MVSEKMTWEEMKKAFPDEWLLITAFELDKYGKVITGVVERHSIITTFDTSLHHIHTTLFVTHPVTGSRHSFEGIIDTGAPRTELSVRLLVKLVSKGVVNA